MAFEWYIRNEESWWRKTFAKISKNQWQHRDELQLGVKLCT